LVGYENANQGHAHTDILDVRIFDVTGHFLSRVYGLQGVVENECDVLDRRNFDADRNEPDKGVGRKILSYDKEDGQVL
jgi:hypothetical protein